MVSFSFRFLLILALAIVATVGPTSSHLSGHHVTSKIFVDLDEDSENEDELKETCASLLETPNLTINLCYTAEIAPSLCQQTRCDHFAEQRGPPTV